MGGLLGIIVTPLFLAVLAAYLLGPLVSLLEKRGINRSLGIAAVYLFIITLLVLLSFKLLPSLFDELQELVSVLPEYTERVLFFLEEVERDYERIELPEGIRSALDENIQGLQRLLIINLERFSQLLLASFSQLFALFLVPLFAYYFLRDGAEIKSRFLGLIPSVQRSNVEEALVEINNTLGAYLRGVFIISITVGGLIYVGLLILGVRFALFLGIVNALTNIIPYFGPVIGAVPVIVIALLQSPELVWKVILLIVVVQQVESQLIAPQVFGKSLGFHPITVIIALLLGGKYLGFFGLVFIIPLLAMARIVLKHFYPLVEHFIRKIIDSRVKKQPRA